jgi:NAD(P)H dehydrogenase (quinone)
MLTMITNQYNVTNMSNVLIITAHPSSKGFTHYIARSYQESCLKNNHQVEILDLYKAPRQDFLVFEDHHETRADQIELREAMQAKVSKADHLVFVHPMWWGNTPAILKNWLDVNLSSGFSHKVEGGKVVKLLTGKTASVYVTSDAPAFIYKLVLSPYKTIWNLITFRFVGIKAIKTRLLGNMRGQTEATRQAFLVKVASDANLLS